MTWVLGMATRFGYATCVSDIQVSWSNGAFHNCLKKTHRLTDSLAVAFAGSIRIGFDLVENLEAYCDTNREISSSPKALMALWPRDARRIFSVAPPGEKRNHSQLLILGMEKEHETSSPVLYRLKSPTFNPEKANESEVFSIGCGSEHYRPILEKLAQQADPLAVYERFSFIGKGIGCGLMMVMHTERKQRPAPGISEELLCTVVSPNDFQQFPYRSSITEAATGNTREVGMPPVAESYAEFKAFARSYGLRATGARAPCIRVRKLAAPLEARRIRRNSPCLCFL